MELKDYTTEELRTELKRRDAEEAAKTAADADDIVTIKIEWEE